MRHIFLSAPRGACIGGFRSEIEERWRDAARIARAELHILEPNEFEIHGEFFTRLWVSELYDLLDTQNDVLISELDFVPEPKGPARLFNHPGFTLVKFIDRVYLPDADVNQKPGQLVNPTIDIPAPVGDIGKVPTIGAWLIKLVPGYYIRRLPRDWLAAGGPHNDAANLALLHLLGNSAVDRNHPLTILQHEDLWPLVHSLNYRSVGAHLFFARDLDAYDNTNIGWTHTAQPLTAERHRKGVSKYLWSTNPLAKISTKQSKAIIQATQAEADAPA